MTFQKADHLIRVQGNIPYLPVSARLIWFREKCPTWGIQTQLLTIDHVKQYAVFRAFVYNGSGKLIATATKMEDAKGFGDYIEKAETGSIGRALGMCGFSTDNDPDFDTGRPGDEAHIVDAPIDDARMGGRR